MVRKIEMIKDFKYKRIIVLGGTSSGKSTLADRISEYTDYPLFRLDTAFHFENWEPKNKSMWGDIQEPFLKNERGIIDGNYSYVLPQRIEWADLIIFIDISQFSRMHRLILRYIRTWLDIEKRRGIFDENKDKFSFKLFKWAFSWNKISRPKTIAILKQIKDKKVLIIKDPKKLDIKKLLEE